MGQTAPGPEPNWRKFGPFLDLCVSSSRRGHANLLCIVPILSDVSEEGLGGFEENIIVYFIHEKEKTFLLGFFG